MKLFKIFFTLLAICLITDTPLSGKSKYDGQKFLVSSGYGWAFDSEYSKSGYSNMNSFIYTPWKHWGFGLDLGFSVAEKRDHSSQDQFRHKSRVYSAGPSAYWIPVRLEKHSVMLGAGVNYTHGRELVQQSPWFLDRTDPIESPEVYNNGVGIAFSTSYSFKITENIGIGARGYCNIFEGIHVSALLNLHFEF